MAGEDAANNNRISARFWGLLLIFIAMGEVKGDERQQKELYFMTRHDKEGHLQNIQQDLNVSSRIFDVSPSCLSTFYQRNFIFNSVNYPRHYEHNSDCIFTVKKNHDVCGLQLIFQDFHLEETYGCLYDYLEINGQRFCGSLNPNTRRIFPFLGPEIVIRFRTNALTSNSGFLIRGSQLTCGQEPDGPHGGPPKACDCDETLDQRQFEVTSPNYDAAYAGDLDCKYVIKKSGPDMCFLQITFVYLDFRESPGPQECLDEYLEMNGQRICHPPTDTTKIYGFDQDNSFLIRFRSRSGSARPPYFRIRGEQLPCPTTKTYPQYPVTPVIPGYPYPPYPLQGPCNCTHQEDEFLVSSEGPHWPPGPSLCSFQVCKSRPDICSLDVVFEHFRLPETLGCTGEYLQVDGQRYCGAIPMGTVRRHRFPGGVLRVNIYTCGGVFSLRFRQIPCAPLPPPYSSTTPSPAPPFPARCDVSRDDPEFRWMSPNYPNPYDSFRDCRMTVQRYDPAVCELVVTFNHFDLEQSEDCRHGYLEVMEQRFCGYLDRGTQTVLPFNASTLTVVFHSGWNLHDQGGFDLGFKQKLCFDGTIFRRSGIDIDQRINLDINPGDHSKSSASLDPTRSRVGEISAGFVGNVTRVLVKN